MNPSDIIITILLSLLVLIGGATFAMIGYFARRMDSKLAVNDQEHRNYDLRLERGQTKIDMIDKHEERLDGHDRDITDIQTKIKYKIVE